MRRLLQLTFLLLLLSFAAEAQNKFWVAPGSSGNWNVAANWSLSSGGAGGAGAPTSAQSAIFDGGSIATCNLNTAFIQLNNLTINSTYTGNIIQPLSTNILLVNGNFNQAGGTFTAAGTGIFNTNFALSGGVFNSPAFGGSITGALSLTGGTFNIAGTLQFDGNINITSPAATLNPGTSKVTFNGSANTTLNINGAGAGSVAFYDAELIKSSAGAQTFTISAGDQLTILRDLELTDGALGGGSGIVSVGRNLFINSDFIGAQVDLILDGSDNAIVTVNAPFTVGSGGITTINKSDPNATVSFITDLPSNSINFNTLLTNSFNINSGTLDFPDNDAVLWNYANFNIGSSGTVNASSNTMTFNSNFTNNGAFNANGGTVDFTTASTRTFSVAGAGTNKSTLFNNVNLNISSASGIFNIQTGDTLIVQGNLGIIDGHFNSPGGSVATPGFVEVDGDLTTQANNEATNTSLALLFGGSGPSTVTLATGTEGNWNGSVNFNKTGTGTVSLSSPLILDQANQIVTFNGGVLNTTSTNILNLGATAVANGGSNSSYVDGPVSKVGARAFTFPVGAGGFYAPVRITGNGINTNLSAASAYIAQYYRADANTTFSSTVVSPLTNVSKVEYWSVNKVSGNDAFIWLSYDDARSAGITNTAELRVANFVSAATNWVQRGQTLGSLSGINFIGTSAFQTNYPTFTLGSINLVSNPLPVTWLDFTGRKIGSAVELTWKTSSEKNNATFSVERSADGKNFSTLGTVAGNGTTDITSQYSFSDKYPLNNVAVYRIKQTDINGKFSYSKEIRVAGTDGLITGFRLYPNPAPTSAALYLENNNWRNQRVKVAIINAIGAVVREEQINFNGDSRTKVNISGIQRGSYYLSTVVNGEKFVVPFIIQ
jgi:hypothetical protein